MYNAKTQEEWRIILANNLPPGKLFDGTGIVETNMYHMNNADALLFANFDKWLSEQMESIRLTADSTWLDYYWDKYGIGKFVSKPESKEDQVRIIKAFAYARRGIFTQEQFREFFQDVFGEDIEITIASAEGTVFDYVFPVSFYSDTDPEWTVIVRIPTPTTLDPGFDYVFDFEFYNEQTFRDAIEKLIEELVDINFRIVIEEVT